MNETKSGNSLQLGEMEPVELKNRWLALLLAWLFPGLGHFYQGRTAKGILFAVFLIPLLTAGVWMGTYRPEGSDTARIASCVYADFPSVRTSGGLWQSFVSGRLYFIPQAANAAMALPALLQSSRVKNGKEPLWNGAFAPPAKISGTGTPTQNELLIALHSWFDLGTIFVAVAGLLNILVMFDAFAGPAWLESAESEDKPETKKN